MIVRFKNALIEVSKVLFNELSIDFYISGTAGGHQRAMVKKIFKRWVNEY